jgi:hypothetical protein
MSQIASDQSPPDVPAKSSLALFLLLCVGASLAGATIAFSVSIVLIGIIDAIASREPQTHESLVVLSATIAGMVLPVVVLRRKRVRKLRHVPPNPTIPPNSIDNLQPAAAPRPLANVFGTEDPTLEPFMEENHDILPPAMPATDRRLTSVPPISAEPQEYMDREERDLDSVLSLAAMVSFAGFAVFSYLFIWTAANQSDALKAIGLVGTPSALAIWVIYVVKALHAADLRFWRLRSTKAGIAMAIVCLLIVLGTFFYVAGATDVGPAACREAGGCGFHGNIRPIAYACSLFGLGFVVYVFKENYDATHRVTLTLSLSVLQLLTIFLVVFIAILYVFRHRSEPVSHKRHW